MAIRAVFFDFDGVIADTENVHIAAWERAFASMGWDVPPHTCAQAAEEDDRQFLSGLFAGQGCEDGDVTGWVEKKQATAIEMLRANPRVYPGVREVVTALADRYALGIVTTTWRQNVTTVLDAAGLSPHFQKIIAKEDVTSPKPDPEGYRLACKKLRVNPSESVAIEDSATGIKAARAAGLHTIAIGHRHDSGEWCTGAAFFTNLTDWSAIVQAIDELEC